jgi:hypothetical protein
MTWKSSGALQKLTDLFLSIRKKQMALHCIILGMVLVQITIVERRE